MRFFSFKVIHKTVFWIFRVYALRLDMFQAEGLIEDVDDLE